MTTRSVRRKRVSQAKSIPKYDLAHIRSITYPADQKACARGMSSRSYDPELGLVGEGVPAAVPDRGEREHDDRRPASAAPGPRRGGRSRGSSRRGRWPGRSGRCRRGCPAAPRGSGRPRSGARDSSRTGTGASRNTLSSTGESSTNRGTSAGTRGSPGLLAPRVARRIAERHDPEDDLPARHPVVDQHREDHEDAPEPERRQQPAHPAPDHLERRPLQGLRHQRAGQAEHDPHRGEDHAGPGPPEGVIGDDPDQGDGPEGVEVAVAARGPRRRLLLLRLGVSGGRRNRWLRLAPPPAAGSVTGPRGRPRTAADTAAADTTADGYGCC